MKDKKKGTKKTREPKVQVLEANRDTVKVLVFDDLEKAWSGVNEYLLREEQEVWSRGGGIYGPEFISYNNHVIVKSCRLNPEFDFGHILGYSLKKWGSLVNNYVDFNYLDLIRSEVQSRTAKKAKSYNYSYHFKNFHGSGKDCLNTAVFTKRIDNPKPIVVFTVRTSEVTKRLIFDFLLLERICEYIYGKDHDVELHFVAPSMYITAESGLMYGNFRPLKKVLKKHIKAGTLGRFQKRILKTRIEFMKPEARNMKYKTFLKAAMQIQRDEHGKPLSGVKPMLAKNLHLLKYDNSEYPEGVISPKARASHRRKNNLGSKRNRKAKK